MTETKSTKAGERTQTQTTFGRLAIGQDFRKQFKSSPIENEWLQKTSKDSACYIVAPEGELSERISEHFMLANNLPVFAFVKVADRRALAMGAEDKPQNNVNPEYRGKVTVNGTSLDVISASVFNGILHYGISKFEPGNSIVGWIPACLCEIE